MQTGSGLSNQTIYIYFIFFKGYDVIAQAQSGTGKTATFAISILQQIDVELKGTQALVLAPTRELAQQVGSHSNTIVCGETCTETLSTHSITGFFL